MKRIFFLVVVALTLSGCSLFGGDDTTDLSASENPTAQPTPNVVQAVPAEGTVEPVDQAGAPLPTAVTLPATPVPPEPTADRSQPTTYVVQAGDVLGLIAERFDVDIAVLRRENNLSGNLIRVGQELIIPAADGSTTAPTSTASTSGSSSAAPAAPRATSAPSGPVSCGSSAGYCIQPGDSLLGIASKLGTTVDALRAANPGIVGDLIRSGQTLNIPGGGSAPSPTVDSGPAPTAGPTTEPAGDDGCPVGYFLWNDGLCYPKPVATATPTTGPTVAPTSDQVYPDYGSGPDCRDGYVLIQATNKCWPEQTNTNPTTVTPVP